MRVAGSSTGSAETPLVFYSSAPGELPVLFSSWELFTRKATVSKWGNENELLSLTNDEKQASTYTLNGRTGIKIGVWLACLA